MGSFNTPKKEPLTPKEFIRKEIITYLKANIDTLQNKTSEDLKDVLKKIKHGDDDDLEWFVSEIYRENMVFDDWVGDMFHRIFKIKNKYVRAAMYPTFSSPTEYRFVKEKKIKIIKYEYTPID